jgi:hypothetical protein
MQEQFFIKTSLLAPEAGGGISNRKRGIVQKLVK